MPTAPPVHRPTHKPKAARVETKLDDRRRGSANARGYTYAWRMASRRFLAAFPLCAECLRYDVISAATDVDHIIPHRGDAALFWDRTNWQPLCGDCHKSKTGRGL